MYLDGGLVGCVVYLVSMVQSASIGQARYFPGVVWDVITDDMANGSLRESNAELALKWGGLMHVYDDGREPNRNQNLLTYLQNHRRRRNRRKHRKNKKKVALLRDSLDEAAREQKNPKINPLSSRAGRNLILETIANTTASNRKSVNSTESQSASELPSVNSTNFNSTDAGKASKAGRQFSDPMNDPLTMLLQSKQAQDDDDYDDGYEDGYDDGYDDDGYDDDGYEPPATNQLGGSQNGSRRRKPSSGVVNNNADDDDDDGYDDDGYDDDGYDDGYDDDDYDDEEGGGVDNQRDNIETSPNIANNYNYNSNNNQYLDSTKAFKRIDVEYQEPDDNENIFVEIKDDEEVVVTKEKKKVPVPVKKKPVKQEEEEEEEDDDEEDDEEEEEEEEEDDEEEEDEEEDERDEDDEEDDDEEDERSAKT